MTLTLYAHPFSSYCQKVLTALYENGTPFTYRQLSIEDKSADAELAALWPLKRFPVLTDDGRTILESSIIIEYLGQHYPGPSHLLPGDAAAVLEARLMDRIFDNYVMTPMQKIVFDFIRPVESRDPLGVTQAREMLDNIYRWLNDKLAKRTWAAGNHFSLADCAAAPSLFYADWTHPIDPALSSLHAYRARLLGRPSFARAVDEGRPFRAFFPLGAPDRD